MSTNGQIVSQEQLDRAEFLAVMKALARRVNSNKDLRRVIEGFSPDARRTVYDALKPLLIRKFTMLSFDSLTRSV